jgi:hypothetical protein
VSGIILAGALGALVVGALTFHCACRGSAEPHAHDVAPEVRAMEARYPDYARDEVATYLTTPEWYEVFSYQEYADHIANATPTSFPYFHAIGQFWSMYCHAYARSAGYPFDFGDHLTMVVIGTSFTGEYTAKGLWEHTIGWVSSLDGTSTSEDRYAATVAREYGKYVETEPWYEYPFGHRALGVWTENPLVERHMLRSMERKSYLTLNYGVTAVYAGVIHGATALIYGAPPENDYVWTNATDAALAVPGVKLLQKEPDGSAFVLIPHYQGFTDAVPSMARDGASFRDVSGNGILVLTVLAPANATASLPHGEVLWTQDVVTRPDLARLVVRARVADLHLLVGELDERGIRIEHLFDY